MKGVPVRIALGPRDLEKNTLFPLMFIILRQRNSVSKDTSFLFPGTKLNLKFNLINKFFKLVHLYFIILNILFYKNRVVHFRYLEEFPWNIIYFINKKNTILFESDCWGYEENVAKIFYDFNLRC